MSLTHNDIERLSEIIGELNAYNAAKRYADDSLEESLTQALSDAVEGVSTEDLKKISEFLGEEQENKGDLWNEDTSLFIDDILEVREEMGE